MTKRERLLAAVAHKPVDRLPVAFWRNWPVDNKDPERLARVSLDFCQRLDMDFMKFSPSHIYIVEDYGRAGHSDGNPGGTDVSDPTPIKSIEQWEALTPLDVRKGALGDFLRSVKLICDGAGDLPILPTVFSPLMVAWLLVDMQYLIWMRQYPQQFKRGLDTISETCQSVIDECLKLGAAGVFYAINHSCYNVMSWDEYKQWGVPGDMAALAVANRGWLNLMHLHGEDLMFGEMATYPVQIINWYDRKTWPSLRQAQSMFGGAVSGGMNQWQTLLMGRPEAVRAEVKDALAQTGGRGFILGSGCQTPVIVPESNLRVAIAASREG